MNFDKGTYQMWNNLEWNPSYCLLLTQAASYVKLIFTFKHLAGAFIQSISALKVYILPLCVIPGNYTHDLDIAGAMLYQLYQVGKQILTDFNGST